MPVLPVYCKRYLAMPTKRNKERLIIIGILVFMLLLSGLYILDIKMGEIFNIHQGD